MKKLWWLVAMMLVCSGAHAFKYIAGKGFEVKFTPAEAQKRLSKALPLSKKYNDAIQVSLDNVIIDVPEKGSRVHATGEASLTLPGVAKPVNGKFKIESGVRYDGASRGIYLLDPVISDVKIPGIPEMLTKQTHTAITSAVKEYAAANAVYTVPAAQKEPEIVKLVVKEVTVADGQFLVILATP